MTEIPFKAPDNEEAVQRFAADLRRLRTMAGHPSIRTISKHTDGRFSPSDISRALSGRELPDWELVQMFVIMCLTRAKRGNVDPGEIGAIAGIDPGEIGAIAGIDPGSLRAIKSWERRWEAVARGASLDRHPPSDSQQATSSIAPVIPLRVGGREGNAATAQALPVTIYLSEESIHEEVEAAVDDLLNAAGLDVTDRDDPVIGSWFRKVRAAIRSPAAQEAAMVAAHMADSRLVLAQDAAITATMLQNLGPVIASLQPTKDAVLRVGALLIVKVDWVVSVFQLTAAQQAKLDHHPQLSCSPHEIIAALQLADTSRNEDRRLRLGE